ncbi:redoxin family protein [Pedobacter caeni]|uniref:Soil-associated protein, TIGR03435 family n=1 Tax=Pedobacter caeni TaxID=288992 RepID=A0A1M5J1E1_9SPHI|nr:redoxin family protein [Pedobacter caeni]SHG34362.1 soil-associated protein, TIGR03435 family [Pedobacter caeni]
MKKILLIALLLLNYAMAQMKNGETVPDLNFATVLNAPDRSVKLSQLKGKIVVLEFWATWCGACLSAMPHLEALQKHYGDQLQIIAISNESEKRITDFLKSRASGLWFAIDKNDSIARVFPHQLLPHTVVLSDNGGFIAGTHPEAVTKSVIDQLLSKKHVFLPEKKDILFSSDEALVDSIFPIKEAGKPRFIMQQSIKGLPGFSTSYQSDSIYKGKRISAVNIGLYGLYAMAYGGYSSKRTINMISSDRADAAYCLDIIVKNEKDLLPELQKELLKRFDIQARTAKQMKEVYVLKIADQTKFNLISRNKTGKRTYYARHGEIDQQAITMKNFAAYLENYGVGKLMVLDETKVNSTFDIKFSFQPENPSSLIKILSDMGLVLNKEQRMVEMLTIYQL